MPKKSATRGQGQPTKYRKEFHCEDFIMRSKQGKTLAQIAFAWDVDRDTVYEWAKVHKDFSDAIKKGRQYAEAWYMELGQAAMLGQARIDGKNINTNLGMFCWLTKNMFKWTDRVATEPERKPNEHRPLKDMSDEDLEKDE